MITQASYREAMSRLGAAVNVITSNGEAGLAGATACAVCSVTDEPPTLLVCLNRSNRSHAILKRNGVLCVNVLSACQEDLSIRFSGSGGATPADRFEGAAWTTLATGAPSFKDAAAIFDCEIDQTVDVGTHTVFFARVIALRMADEPHGLIYFARRYVQVGKVGAHLAPVGLL